jgi:RNA-directed DNA polymerase
VHAPSTKWIGTDFMTNESISVQDLRRRIYIKAKAEPSWRFWGLYVHVCKTETLREGFRLARLNNGAPGIDGETFAMIEERGVDLLLTKLREELVTGTYRPQRVRKVAIPKPGGRGERVLSIPTIRDRVVQGALKAILEPIFEADFQPGSYGYRPKKSAQQAVANINKAIFTGKTRVIDLDLRAYFDSVQHDKLLRMVAARVNDDDVMRLLRQTLKATGRCGVPQGGVISPVLSNLYLNEVDKMLERARESTRHGPMWTAIAYARYADDLVVLVSGHPLRQPLLRQVQQRLREEFAKLGVEVNEDKSKVVDLTTNESFSFCGFVFRRTRGRNGKWRPFCTPRMETRTALLRRLKDIFRRYRSQPVASVIRNINPILRGWVTYFRVGDSGRCFNYVRDWVEKKMRRHLSKARKRPGFGWKRWSRSFLYDRLGLHADYKLVRIESKVGPA